MAARKQQIYFKKFTWNWLSIMIGFHHGINPVDGKRFLHIAPIPFLGLDFGFREDENRIHELERAVSRLAREYHYAFHDHDHANNFIHCTYPTCVYAASVLYQTNPVNIRL